MNQSENDFRCIAVDMGAGSIRIMLGSIVGGAMSFREIHRFANRIVLRDGHERWDIELIINEIMNGIRKAVDASDTVPESIGVDSWGVDFVLLDDQGELVDIPVSYRDSRTEGMRELWASEMSEMETFQRTGINFYPFNTLFQLRSLRDSELLERTSRILFLPCYINYLLSGNSANELTISSTSQMLEIHGDQWDPEILRTLHLEREVLGDVIRPGTRLGSVSLPGMDKNGFESIAVCGHDTACVVAAVPVEDPDFVFISAGTWCILGIESDTPLISREALELGLTNERGYDNSYRIEKNITGLWLLQGLKKELPEDSTFEEMEKMTSEGGEVNQVIDPDDPLFYNPDNMREAFDAFFERTGQERPVDLSGYMRCAYDSLCFSFLYHIEKLEELSGKRFRTLHVVGGGSQSELLNQKIATICKRQVVSGPVEGATIGNMIIQAMAMERIRNLSEARELVRHSFPGKIYHPGPKESGIEKRYHTYLSVKS